MPMVLGLMAGTAIFLLLSPGRVPGRPTPLSRLYAKLGVTPVRATPTVRPPWVRKIPLAPLVAIVRQTYPARFRERMERQLRISRLDTTYTYDDILALKVVSALACGFYALLMYLKGRDPYLAAFMTGLATMGFMYPDVWLANRASKRQEQIRRELPALLSALAVALEAGLTLMAALSEVTRDRKGAFAFELRQAVDLNERGLAPADALERVARRLEVSEFTVTLTGLMQAFAKGSSHVVGTVRNQAAEAWQKRKRGAEAMAQTASIKLFMPIALLALPGFMIFLLGPAVLEVIDYLLK